MKSLRLLTVAILLMSLWSCKKGGLNSIKCQVVDRYTGEPISDIYLRFDVAKGAGLFGSLEKEKYDATTDENGKFKLSKLGDDRSATFYISNFMHGIDTTQVEGKYIRWGFSEDSLWVSKKSKTVLELKPAGVVCFHHPIVSNPNYSVDQITVKAYGQEEVLTDSKQVSEAFYFFPSEVHEIELTYIFNGQEEHRTISRYIPNYYKGDGAFKQLDIFIPE